MPTACVMSLCPWEDAVTSQRHSALGGGRDAFERTLDSRDTKIPASEEGRYDITGPAFLKLRCPGALDHRRVSLSSSSFPSLNPTARRSAGKRPFVPQTPSDIPKEEEPLPPKAKALRAVLSPRAFLMSSESTHHEAPACTGSFSSLLHFQLRSPASSSSTLRSAHKPRA